ncbi:MAG: hypothetical protein M3541_09325 [Acidobacteriota bacterium]|nr:hypothetical protein [Acidobacteriota bacterium]
MRKYLLFAVAAGLLAFMAPLAIADTPDDDTVAAPVAVQRVSFKSMGLRDEATMIIVGTALIGLAAAVRRAA